MPEILVITLLIIIAFLSKAGRIRKNPVSGVLMTNIQSLVLQRGISTMLMIPVLAYSINAHPFWMDMTSASVVSVILIVVLVPVLSFMIVRPYQSGSSHEIFTGLQTGTQEWGIYLVSTAAYMVVYEIFLRGILLYYLVDWVGVAIAIAVNTLIYVAMHLFKDLREALFCIPLGVFFCWITLYTKSVWPAAVLHLVMAVSFELFYNAKRTHVNV